MGAGRGCPGRDAVAGAGLGADTPSGARRPHDRADGGAGLGSHRLQMRLPRSGAATAAASAVPHPPSMAAPRWLWALLLLWLSLAAAGECRDPGLGQPLLRAVLENPLPDPAPPPGPASLDVRAGTGGDGGDCGRVTVC